MPTTFRNSDAPKPGMAGTMVWVALLTILTTVATNYVIIRYGLIPAPPKAAAGKPLAGPVKPKVVRDPATPVTPADTADALRQASDSATAVLNTIDTIRTTAGTDFVGPNAHTGLNRNFTLLTQAATNVVNAGDNPAAEQQAVTVFTRALDNTIRNAVQISQRPTESADSVQISAQVASSLGDIRATLP